MNKQELQKPGVEEWLHWAEILLERLTGCVHVFKKPPYLDVFIPEAEIQQKTDETVKLLHRIHALIDRTETPTDSIADLHTHDEQIIDGIATLFREGLEMLPQLSADMQKLLKSPWQSNFPNKTAQNLFLGAGDESQGIGSGYPEQGRLPEALFGMLEREQIGDARKVREVVEPVSEPRRHDMKPRRKMSSAGHIE